MAVSGVAIYAPYAGVVPTIVRVFFSGRRAALAVATRLIHTHCTKPGFRVATDYPVPIVVGVVYVVGGFVGDQTVPVFTAGPSGSRAIDNVAPLASRIRK